MTHYSDSPTLSPLCGELITESVTNVISLCDCPACLLLHSEPADGGGEGAG